MNITMDFSRILRIISMQSIHQIEWKASEEVSLQGSISSENNRTTLQQLVTQWV